MKSLHINGKRLTDVPGSITDSGLLIYLPPNHSAVLVCRTPTAINLITKPKGPTGNHQHSWDDTRAAGANGTNEPA